MFIRLAKSSVFKGIIPEVIEELVNSVPYQIKKYDKEDIIASRTDECSSLMVIVEGCVRGEMLDYSGKVLKVEDIFAPRPIAAAFLFGQNNRFPVDVIANTEVSILKIPKESVIKLFQHNDQFLKNYLNAISNRAQFLSQRIWFLSFKTIKGKLAQYILNLLQENMKIVTLPLPQKEVAEFFGVTRPSLARALGEMEKDGIIEVNRREITINDKARLIGIIE
ncbi:MAG: Crp/Fnr family transcriptional regulator [Salinivirgaceae bacterium]|jgi:CRP-like cAMP-binding protein|nr:Crp/Fnr family transcriptional regulator [Salinivirgaceae bacterium]